MRAIIHTFILAITMIMASCGGGNKDINYKSHTAQNKSYSVEIPTDFSIYSCFDGDMIFKRESSNSSDFATIRIKPTNNGFSTFKANLNSNPKFDFQIYRETVNAVFASCSKGMWTANKFAMIKNLEGQDYIIEISSQGLKSQSEKIIQHIHDSMQSGVPYNISTNADNSDFKKYENPYLSILYPKDWECLTNIDEMTDAYIGSSDGELTFSIVRFETDASLQEIEKESKDNSNFAGMRVISDVPIIINGHSGFKMVNEWMQQGQTVKAIGYNFKKDSTFICIKFGAAKAKVDRNAQVIESIIQTFKIK